MAATGSAIRTNRRCAATKCATSMRPARVESVMRVPRGVEPSSLGHMPEVYYPMLYPTASRLKFKGALRCE
eukprot:6459222-Pyramimonas_sp.AAC.1